MSRSTQLSKELDAVSDFFVHKSFQEGRPITNKKVQKLAYYAQAWNLVFNDSVLFNDPIEAWIHGPAVRTLYAKYKKYGYMGIAKNPNEPSFAPRIQNVLSDVWEVYGKYDADYLEVLSHTEQPWLAARGEAEKDQRTEVVIDIEIMKRFYADLLGTVKKRTQKA